MGLKGDSPSPPFVVYHHPTEYFSTELFTKFAYLPQRSMIPLSAKMDRYPDWVRGQPGCAGTNPALPKL